MKSNRNIAYLSGIIALAVPIVIYALHIRHLGFPDGHITELGRAEIILFKIFLAPVIGLGFYFFYLGWPARRESAGKKLRTAYLLFILLVVVILVARFYFLLRFDNGTGG